MSERSKRMELLGDEIATLAAHIAAATARWLLLIAEFDEGGGWSDGGYKNCAHWLSWRCGIAPGTARDHLRVAHGLKRRPLIAAAFERGELSYSKVRALLRLDDDFSEELVLGYADSASAGQLERIVRGCRRVTAIEGGTERQFAERELSWSFDEAGAVVLRGRLPAELGALVVRAVEAARDELGPPPAEVAHGLDAFAAEQCASPRARNADALVALAQSSLAQHAPSADVYQVVVHVDADALSVSAETDGGDCRLEDAEPLPKAAARRLTCDGSIVRVLEKDGRTISMGRKTRTIPPAMRRALRIRDGGCAFPGCTQRHHTDGHHIEHWADGGRTHLENLVQLCRFHHRLLHEGGFAVRRTGSELAFYDPRGKPIPQAPRMPRGDCVGVEGSSVNRRLRPAPLSLFPQNATQENVNLAWSVEALIDSRRRE